jgi:hypothetical protein
VGKYKIGPVKITMLLTVIFVVFYAASLVPYVKADATIAVDPLGGPPGTAVTLSGDGFPQNTFVDIYFGASIIKTVKTGPSSSDINAQFTIPETAAGQVTISARDSFGDNIQTVFTILPGSTDSASPSGSGSTDTPSGTDDTGGSETDTPIDTGSSTDSFLNTTNIAIIVIVLIAIFIPLTLLYMRRGGNRRDMYDERRGGDMGPYGGGQQGGYGPGPMQGGYGQQPPQYGGGGGYGGSPYARPQGGYGPSPYARPAGYGGPQGGYGGRPMGPGPQRYGPAPGGYGGGYGGRPMGGMGGGMRSCPNCRAPVRDDQNICPNCNRRLR